RLDAKLDAKLETTLNKILGSLNRGDKDKETTEPNDPHANSDAKAAPSTTPRHEAGQGTVKQEGSSTKMAPPPDRKINLTRTKDILFAVPELSGRETSRSGEKWCQIVERTGTTFDPMPEQLVEIARLKAKGEFKTWLEKTIASEDGRLEWRKLRELI